MLDNASPELASIRERLRQQRAKLRTTLESFVRGKDTSKYLQEQVVTERNGRYVLMVRAEHRSNVPGIVHGASASGASLFLEPLATVEINNDIVALEEQRARRDPAHPAGADRRFRGAAGRPARARIEVATELDVVQARARFSLDGRRRRAGDRHDGALRAAGGAAPAAARVHGSSRRCDDRSLDPPNRVLLITGPEHRRQDRGVQDRRTVRADGAGRPAPAGDTARLPVFRSVFADIGDEQSIAASLSTFSAHITNLVSMDRDCSCRRWCCSTKWARAPIRTKAARSATAIVSHFRQRGALSIATTHFDALKTWGTATEGVAVAAFAFDPQTFAPTYRLIYGAPGRSLAIEMAQRLGMPAR